MTKPKKIIKKKLKEPDELITLTERIYLFFTRHYKTISIGGVIVLILVLSFFFYQKWKRGQEENAYQLFNIAIESYHLMSSPSREGSPQEYKNIIEKFNEVITKFPKTPSGKLSVLYKGNVYLRLGEFEEAIKAYEDFIQKEEGEKLYRSFAMEGLGYAYEGKKDYEKSVRAFKKLVEIGNSFQIGNAYLGLGRCYEKLGKNQEALESYKSFLKVSTKSVMTNIVLRKISLLEKEVKTTQ